jgi:hypothetical protein
VLGRVVKRSELAGKERGKKLMLTKRKISKEKAIGFILDNWDKLSKLAYKISYEREVSIGNWFNWEDVLMSSIGDILEYNMSLTISSVARAMRKWAAYAHRRLSYDLPVKDHILGDLGLDEDGDLFPDLTTDLGYDETEEKVLEFMSLLSEEEREITSLLLAGHNQTNVARITRKGLDEISNILQRIRLKAALFFAMENRMDV